MQAWKAVTNLKQVGKVVHIYEVCILGEASKGGHQQREPLLSAGWCQLVPCTDRQNKDSENDKVTSPLPSEAQNAAQLALETDQTSQLTTIVMMMLSKNNNSISTKDEGNDNADNAIVIQAASIEKRVITLQWIRVLQHEIL